MTAEYALMEGLIVVTGSKESNKTKKSAELCSILSSQNKMDHAVLYTAASHISFEYKKQLFNLKVKDSYQSKDIGLYVKGRVNDTYNSNPTPSLLILDDRFDNFSFNDEKVWKFVLSHLEDTKIIVVIVTNDLNSLPQLFRNHVTYQIECLDDFNPISGTRIVRCNTSKGVYKKQSTPDVYRNN